MRHLYFAAKVFDKADKLVDKFRAKAEALADDVEPTEFRELLYYLVDTRSGETRTASPGSGAVRGTRTISEN